MNRQTEFRIHLEQACEAVDRDLAAGEPPAAHYDAESWMALYEARVSPADRAAMETHLATCPSCRELAGDIEDFCAPAREDEADLSEFETRRTWNELRDQLPFEIRRRTGFVLGTRAAMAMAAGLLVTTSLAGFFAYRLWQTRDAALPGLAQQKIGRPDARVDALPLPTLSAQSLANAPVFDLPIPLQTRGAEPEPKRYEARVPESAGLFTLRIAIQNDAFDAYAIEFTDANGAPRWKQPDLKPDARASAPAPASPTGQPTVLSVALPRSGFPAGRYRFTFHGQKNDQLVPLETLEWTFR